MKNTKVVIVGSFAAAVAMGAISISVASADASNNKHKTVQDAIRNNDFKAFVTMTDKNPVLNEINTKKEFAALTLSYKLRQEGKYKEAREVLERARIEHPGLKRYNHRSAKSIRKSVQNNDWTAFQKAAKGKKIYNIINTEHKFNLFVEMHELRKDKIFKEANKIQKELKLYGNRYMK